ncbi:MAG TPA: hypothetical protein VN088_07865 [Nocardioides sp.]|nr:hypothetical protein [Nocardioides sp.]
MSSTSPHGVPRVALLLLVPVVALLGSVYLPFVNDPGLVLGLPRLFLWTTVWVVAITPLLWLVERTRWADADDALDTVDAGAER